MPDKKIFGNDGPSKPDLPMSTFDKSFTNNMSARFGRVYPNLVEMCCPHSTAHITPHIAFDMMPTVSPVQANIRFHQSYYKVPLRVLFRNYQDFFSRVGNHVLPYIKRSGNWCQTGSLADYMGLPTQRYTSVQQRHSINFVNRGYIKREVMQGSLVPETSLHSYYHSNLVTRAGSTSDVSDDLHVLETVVDAPLLDGVFLLPLILDSTTTTPTNQNFGGSWSLNLLAVRCVASDTYLDYDDVSQNYRQAPNTRNYRVVSWVNGSLSHDNTPSSGVFEPFSNLSPGQYALHSNGFVTRSYNGISYKQGNLVFKLSDAMLSAVNDLYREAEDAGQKVFLLLSWSTSSIAEGYFGSSSPIAGVGKVSPTGSNLVFDNPINTIVDKDTGNLRSTSLQTVTFPPVVGLGGLGYFNADMPLNTADEKNPFVSYDGADPQIPISAFAFRAYEFIHNYFFRNERVDPFLKVNPDTGELEPTYNQFITNDGDGADETTPLDFFNAPYEYDLFTTCQKTPQFGNAPLVGITTNDDSDTAEILMRGQRLIDGVPEQFDYTIAVKLGDNNQILQISNYDEVADHTSVMRLNEAIRYGISINDFRSVNAFQIMQERFLKAGYLYPDLVEEFFGVRPPVGENYPEYLGGITREINVSKIQNLAKSADAALGEFAGTGQVAGHGERIECFCAEWSLIIGVCWFSVTPVYSQILPKHFMYSGYLDFYNPALMSIGPQPVFKKQLSPLQLPRKSDGTLDEEHINDVFGYNRPWSDMVSRQDEAHGEFRSSMHSYLLQRLFSNAPDLGSEFLHMDSKDLTDIFSYMFDTDKFYGAVRHEMYVKMPLPRVSLPRII